MTVDSYPTPCEWEVSFIGRDAHGEAEIRDFEPLEGDESSEDVSEEWLNSFTRTAVDWELLERSLGLLAKVDSLTLEYDDRHNLLTATVTLIPSLCQKTGSDSPALPG